MIFYILYERERKRERERERERIIQASLFKFAELVLVLGPLLYISDEHVFEYILALESQLFDEARFSLAPFGTNASL